MARKAAPPPIVLDPAKPDAEGEVILAPEAGEEGADDESTASLKEQLATANKRAEDAEAARVEAEGKATDAERRAQQGQNQLTISHAQVIENALAGETARKTELKTKIVAAKEAGDYAAEVEATDELQAVNAKILRLNEGKDELDRRAEIAKTAINTDPVEQYIANMTPKAQSWIRARPELVTDTLKNAELVLAHQQAMRSGHAEGSDGYYQFIEDRLDTPGGKSHEDDEQGDEDVDVPVKRGAPPPAPVRRSGGNGHDDLPPGVRRLGADRFSLSPELREAARISGLSDSDYLKNLLELQQEGRLTRH